MADVEQIKALVAQVTGDSQPQRKGEDWRDWRCGVELSGTPARATLVEIGTPAVPYLIERIKDNYVRWVLRDMGDPAVQPLIDALKDEARIREVIGVLAESQSTLPIINDTLWELTMAHHHPPEVRTQAIFALAHRRDPRALDLVLKDLEATTSELETQPDGRRYNELHTDLCATLNALGRYGDPRAVPHILPYLTWAEPENTRVTVRSRAAHALGEIGDPSAVDPLLEQLPHESHYDSRLKMAEALCLLGDPRVIPVVEQVAAELLNPPIIMQPLNELKRKVQSGNDGDNIPPAT